LFVWPFSSTKLRPKYKRGAGHGEGIPIGQKAHYTQQIETAVKELMKK